MQIANRYATNMFNLKSVSNTSTFQGKNRSLNQDSVSFTARPGVAPLIAGNIKMNKLPARYFEDLSDFTKNILNKWSSDKGNLLEPEVLVCPNDTYLRDAHRTLAENSSSIKLGAQNFFYEPKGAYTGELSGEMLKDAGANHVIIGHSERRTILGETDEMINKKVKAALNQNITPIICCGESIELRDKGTAVVDNYIKTQINKALEGVSTERAGEVVIAYEPIWAINTGKTCDAQEAGRVTKLIRSLIAEKYDVETAEKVRILYGGSAKASNAQGLISQRDVDGFLVGGASLEADSFAQIVENISKVKI